MDKSLAYVASLVFLLSIACFFIKLIADLVRESVTYKASQIPTFVFYLIWGVSIVLFIVSLAFAIEFTVRTPWGKLEFWQIPGGLTFVCFVMSWFMPKKF